MTSAAFGSSWRPLLQHHREQAVDRLPRNLGDPLLADVRDHVQGQVPGAGFLTVRLDIAGASARCRRACRSVAWATSRAPSAVSNVPALLYVPSTALQRHYSPLH